MATNTIQGKDGSTYSVQKEYGQGVTMRGWAAFRRDGVRWVGTRFSGETKREVIRQMEAAGVL